MRERQKLVSGTIALGLATICILALPMIQMNSMIGGTILGLLSVAFFVYGTLSIGTSEQGQVALLKSYSSDIIWNETAVR